jgi:predicted trehalose synthase
MHFSLDYAFMALLVNVKREGEQTQKHRDRERER